MTLPTPAIEVHSFTSSLQSILNLQGQNLQLQKQPLKQLRAVEKHVASLANPCKSVVIERHYIDRDYIEEHSIFYSKSLFQYTNSCRRVHFFSLDSEEVRQRLKDLNHVARTQGKDKYRAACRQFSEDAYLGFCVIKPLHGCPVGRTVLKCIETSAGNDEKYNFESTRMYKAHLAGVELTVKGLPFQQQDIGVSACATIALWSALHKARDFENVWIATPAQITTLASRYSLPFGGPLPSEGLTVDQMCQVVRAFGLSAALFRADDLATAKSYIHSATISGFAPILILRDEKAKRFHAVITAGLQHPELQPSGETDEDVALALKTLFIHDDRNGPYLKAHLENASNNLGLNIETFDGSSVKFDDGWIVSHILIPVHAKIRISFFMLRKIALLVCGRLESLVPEIKAAHQSELVEISSPSVRFQSSVALAHRYVEHLLIECPSLSLDRLETIYRTVPLSRYVGIVRFSVSYCGNFDLLVDTTSTQSNLYCLAIILTEPKTRYAADVIKFLAGMLKCPAIY